MQRSSIMLVHLSSLPGPFGHGTLGPEALAFGEKLAAAGFTYWQVLPLGQPSADSPYMCLSAFAGNTRLIDPRRLVEEGWLHESELGAFHYSGTPHRTDFHFAEQNSQRYLELAFTRLHEGQKSELEAFAARNFWLRDYAIFMVARARYDFRAWWQWPDRKLAAHDAKALTSFCEEEREALLKVYFGQWLFKRQWDDFKARLNALGLGIFGDMPYYVAQDSAEVWARRDIFVLNKKTFLPREVAGVPPDYFSASGQLWGFPVFDWKALEAQGYDWWIRRIEQELKRYDLLRIDHFRGLSAYWCVPYGRDDARVGRWRKGPGMKLFNAAQKRLGPLPIVAEDLGLVDADLLELLENSAFPRMKVLQFALEAGNWSQDLPHDYPRNCCAYTGTHDNNTVLGWLWEATPEVRNHALDYCAFPSGADWGKGGAQSPSCQAFMRSVWSSCALLAGAPLQDFLGYGSDARMNTPAVAEGCWSFRVDGEALSKLDFASIKKLNALYQRDRRFDAPNPEPKVKQRLK